MGCGVRRERVHLVVGLSFLLGASGYEDTDNAEGAERPLLLAHVTAFLFNVVVRPGYLGLAYVY